MFVVRRPFRNYGQVLLPGSVVDPATTKRFKSRLNDRVIVEVTAGTFEAWKAYFKTKFGVDLHWPEAKTVAKAVPAEKPKVKAVEPVKVTAKVTQK